MPKIVQKPELTNRGPAGLLTKLPTNGEAHPQPEPSPSPSVKVAEINLIAPNLRAAGLVTQIAHLTPDPRNARLHPERNMEAIRDSLAQYGQVKTIVVLKSTMTVIAGNGTMEAAKQLGWTEIAANIVDMTEVEATGFGLADNRTSELAKWDFEVVAMLDKLIQEQNEPMIGWTKDELEVMRMADWTPPPVKDDELEELGDLKVIFKKKSREGVDRALEALRVIHEWKKELTDSQCLEMICSQWFNLLPSP